jgi:(p)ppGpp synthase/HD superfamily hydrolase
MATLERAIAIALDAHIGQVDKAGAPYVLHPLRVMLSLTSPEDRMAGVLHDVVEDGGHRGWTLDALRREGFPGSVIEAVDAVTKRLDENAEGWEPYARAIRRAAGNPIARRVKMADLTDNLDVTRITSPSEKDLKRLDRYRRAMALLRSL